MHTVHLITYVVEERHFRTVFLVSFSIIEIMGGQIKNWFLEYFLYLMQLIA